MPRDKATNAASDHHLDRPHAYADWEDEIRHHFGARYVVLGMGSRVRGDDAAGCMVAEGLAKRGIEHVFDCGGVPENYVAKVEQLAPTDILFIDAVDFGQEPGAIELFGGERFGDQSISTHSAGLSPVMEYLSRTCNARCWVLAIQPQTVDYSTALSEAVRRAVRQIVSSSVWCAS